MRYPPPTQMQRRLRAVLDEEALEAVVGDERVGATIDVDDNTVEGSSLFF